MFPFFRRGNEGFTRRSRSRGWCIRVQAQVCLPPEPLLGITHSARAKRKGVGRSPCSPRPGQFLACVTHVSPSYSGSNPRSFPWPNRCPLVWLPHHPQPHQVHLLPPPFTPHAPGTVDSFFLPQAQHTPAPGPLHLLLPLLGILCPAIFAWLKDFPRHSVKA